MSIALIEKILLPNPQNAFIPEIHVLVTTLSEHPLPSSPSFKTEKI